MWLRVRKYYICMSNDSSGCRSYLYSGGVESTSRAPWKIKRPQSVYDTQLPEFYERASFAPKGQDPSMIEAKCCAILSYYA